MGLRKQITVTESKFSMWRAAIAVAHSDHTLSDAEMDIIRQYSAYFAFSDAQKSQLEKDFQSGLRVEDVYDDITDKRDRAYLINFARVLSHADGDFCNSEKKMMDVIYNKHMETIDLDTELENARSAREAYEQEDVARQTQEKGSQRWFENAFEFLTKIDL